MSSRRSLLTSSVILTALVLSNCSSTSRDSSTSTTLSFDLPKVERISDGVLRLGFMAPLNDKGAPFGRQLLPIVESVVRTINSYGGFNQRAVELVTIDEGGTPDSARRAAKELIFNYEVDAVIGPFSSINAPSVIPLLTSAGIGICSPSASALNLDLIDDDGLFIRTTTLDSAIVEGMAGLAVRSGSATVSLAFPDDQFGRPLARVLRTAVEELGLTISSEYAYSTSSEDYERLAIAMTNDEAPVELIIANQIDGPRFLNAVVAFAEKSIIITNDAVVNSIVSFEPALSEEFRPRIFGIVGNAMNGGNELLNVIRVTDPDFPQDIFDPPAFSVNTVDCFALIWLTALIAESDDALVFKDKFLSVANTGLACFWFSDCKLAIDDNLNLDYQGVSNLELDSTGNASGGVLSVFEFGADGRARLPEETPSIRFTG